MATQAELIAKAKKDWELANASGNKVGMATAKQSADSARGYLTDASGTNKIGELKSAMTQQVQKVEQPQTAMSATSYTSPTPSPTMTGKLVNFRDQAGNLQALDEYYVTSNTVPKDWVRDSGQSTVTVPSSNESDIQAKYKANTDALTAALKQRIAESVQSQKSLISSAGQRYDPLRAQSELSKEQQLRSTMERASLSGDRGGVGRMEALGVQTSGEQRLGDINLQQQNFVDSANAEISRLQNEGLYQEAQIVAEQKSKELQDIMAERARVQGIQREDTRYQEEIARDDATIARQLAERDRSTALNMLPQYANQPGGYQARINQVTSDNDPSNDWEVAPLNILRNEKVSGIESAKAQAEKTAYERQEAARVQQEKTNLELMKLKQNKEESAADRASREAISRRSASSGSSGPTASQQLSMVKFKVDNNIPLTPQETALIGGTPSEASGGMDISTWQDALDRIDKGSVKIAPFTNKSTPDESARQTKSAELIMSSILDGSMTDDQARQLIVSYGISPEAIQAAENKLTGGK